MHAVTRNASVNLDDGYPSLKASEIKASAAPLMAFASSRALGDKR